ncbi:MAG: hypothetical protein ACTSV3_03230 [Candidatus Thorarchaeota archaeon]|nr:MAG: hypothetical protein DRO87_09440 [Candidatus Thorarchaeota archaeon]RLI57804.1 MAG: hypothetical protein DRP09_01835 [Candidatus Thorarchaeota archaeon]
MMRYKQSIAYPWALTGIFSAVHLVITLIPYSITVSGGGQISFGLISAPIVGFLLGPFFGVIAVIIGSLVATLMDPLIAVLGPFTVLATAAGAFAAGAMRTKLRASIQAIYILSMVMFLISPIGPLIPQFILFHFVVFLLSLLFLVPGVGRRLLDALTLHRSVEGPIRLMALWLLSIVAVTLDNVVGSAIGAYYFNIAFLIDPVSLAGMFSLAIPIIPVERLIGSVMVAMLLLALVEVLERADFGLPLSRVGRYELLELEEEPPQSTSHEFSEA